MVKRALELDISFLADIHTKWRATPCRPTDSFRTPLAAKTCCRQGRRAGRRRSGTVQGQRPARAGPRGSIVPLRRRRARRTRRRALRPHRHWRTRCAAVRGAPCARRRACACAHVRPASATRDTGSRQCRRSHSGRRRRRSVRRRRRRRDAGRRALAHDRQGALRRWKNLVILKHKLDIRADAGVAT